MVDVSKPLWRLYKKFGEKHKTGQLSRAGQQQGDRGLVLATATNISWHGRVEESDNLNYNPMYSKNTAASTHSKPGERTLVTVSTIWRLLKHFFYHIPTILTEIVSWKLLLDPFSSVRNNRNVLQAELSVWLVIVLFSLGSNQSLIYNRIWQLRVGLNWTRSA